MNEIGIKVTSDVEVDAGFKKFRREIDDVKRDLKELDRVGGDIGVKVDVDDSEVKTAEKEIRDLDTIPDPDIKIDADASDAVANVEDQFAGIDLGNMAGAVTDQISGMLSAVGPIGAAIGAAGVVFGEDLATGLGRGFTAQRDRIIGQVRFGLSPQEFARIGETSGDAWAAGFGESLADVKESALLLRNTLGQVDDGLNLDAATRQAQALNTVFGIDLPQSIGLARRLVATDLVADTQTAFNLMGGAAQDFALDADEILEVLHEFAPVFSRLGVDGARAVDIIGKTVNEGLLPNIDRAAELFEEFNIRVTDGTAREAVEALGLSFERMQQQVAEGRGAEAMAELADALLDVGIEADRNELAVELFGTAIESAADPGRVLELLSVADAMKEVGTTADDAADAVEETATGLGLAKRRVEELAAGVSFLAFEWNALSDQDVDEVIALHEAEAGIVRAENLTDALRDLGETEMQARNAAESMSSFTSEAAESMGELADETNRAEDALAGFADFSFDQHLRSVRDQAARVVESMEDVEESVFDASGAIDVGSQSGRDFQGQMERVNGVLQQAAQDFVDGAITAEEFGVIQDEVRDAVARAGEAAGGTTEAVDALITKYGEVPKDVSTELGIVDRATHRLDDFQRLLNRIPSTRRVTIEQVFTSRGNRYTQHAHGGNVGSSFAQAGGVRANQVIVGEAGPEIVDLAPGSRVHSNPDTRRMLEGGTGTQLNLTVNVTGTVIAETDLEGMLRDSVQRGLLDDILERLPA